jgi:MATE family multidrug resistance protein
MLWKRLLDVRLRRIWRGPGGAREVLLLGYPLMLSQLSFTLQTFIDRLFLTWYSPEAMAGAVTGLFAVWVVIGLFIGTGEFLTAFVAQYLGSGRPRRVGPTLWQGFYFALLAGVVLALLAPLAPAVFDLAGHAPNLRHYEVQYAQVLLLGGGAVVLMATLSTFFAGRGQTRVILLVNVLVTFVNVGLDWWWIFPRGARPGYGVVGAAWATIVAQLVGAACYATIMLRRTHRERYGTLTSLRPEPALLLRLLRYGLPTGLQFTLEILAFEIFIIMIGRLGVTPLAATTLAFNLNMLVFMPLLGLGMGVSSLVARYLGAERPEVAERCVHSALLMGSFYMLACGALYVLAPGLLLAPFAMGSTVDFTEIADTATVLLRFVAFYSIFDMFNVLCASGLKGAGDTRFPLLITFVFSWALLLGPAYVACVVYGYGLYVGWLAATAYVLGLSVAMCVRFRRGGWKRLRVVEPMLTNDSAPLAVATA